MCIRHPVPGCRRAWLGIAAARTAYAIRVPFPVAGGRFPLRAMQGYERLSAWSATLTFCCPIRKRYVTNETANPENQA